MHTWASVDVPRLPGEGPPLRLHDTSTGRVRPTAPGREALMYVCGITPYDATHLGHAATYLAFDLVNRLWRDLGHDVHYVQNVTDIDDPLLERAARDQDDWVVLGMRETALFREDMEALRVLPPRHFIGAVEAMGEISELVGKLLASGAAYRVDDAEFPDVYFDSAVTGHFGYESNYDEETMLRFSAERGGDPERPGKRSPLDPLLWRTAREGEPSWESDLGAGRPGWHVECAAIALNRLGTQIDLNGGGSDLIFPHHECGAAHAEAFTGVHPFARHYTHTGMIGLDGEKMSKSRGNLVFVSKLRAENVDPNAIRIALLAGHYRSDRAWTSGLLDEANARLVRWREAAALPAAPPADELLTRLRTHLADDLDTPRALVAVDAWADRALERRGTDGDAPALFRDALDALLGVRL
ncbi:cysteine--1-D-myo-inosityl 2-amino-2-deoxy-alpha-D-glucopyranoside ligase [Pseudonocardia sp. KRD-184]|uniref:L-cysteine:1D-myo-inositol 2-amino-2-deoxy-alpha-D-glucopyranoside ligase n=1 Tax=Pseudonocardia oceani TaxID=2792013 RepID=A0ABS6UIL8_9PSEU|nr:cysteine--1-D-myo-inosityl 2-amino-2-deoxy-alpha-D-glucopyranoside ligase [Pseudonocardia oceani]MBW0090662.1 cysteine--1-D-myo-inosityl 2-amino-2-deoxy-alpha-D-glucopyranoside ligase [Pseudonocardia oceani]MBW0097796.1 cysteine--1-D-myo-inosityl 2-amino-2-deoxy-alpha-D-glucopyranoside ligase [Pseudonocardia oceani]MBW0112765.1 cysteine--1-D-myo-inosityl 2-amino-2-deoxy-alpha-D-glucopyranoside ligase [Pseudonocardia oceani]MBW0122657.1 cysteine--1-D-myo-inosityl 2-amino-2-deoxy-alpha-D-gluco